MNANPVHHFGKGYIFMRHDLNRLFKLDRPDEIPQRAFAEATMAEGAILTLSVHAQNAPAANDDKNTVTTTTRESDHEDHGKWGLLGLLGLIGLAGLRKKEPVAYSSTTTGPKLGTGRGDV